MREQLIGCGAFRTKISLTDRRLRVPFDRNQFAVLVIDELPAADATIWANKACDFRVVDTCMHRTRLVRHGFRAGAIFAFANLPNERPFRKQREHNLYPILRSGSGLQSFESFEILMLKLAKRAKTNAAGSFLSLHRETAAGRSHAALRFLGMQNA